MSKRRAPIENPAVAVDCHQCKANGIAGFDVFPYLLGFYNDKPAIRWAHRGECSGAMYAGWRKFTEVAHG